MALTSKLEALKAQREQFEKNFQQELEAMRAQEQELLKASEAGEKLVAAVKKINMEPSLAYEILVEAGLIQAPVSTQDDDKDEEGELLGLYTFAPAKEGGRSSSFKFTKGLNVSQLQAVKKGRWAQIKAKGKDYFVSGLNTAGKDWLESDSGQEFINRHFPDAASM